MAVLLLTERRISAFGRSPAHPPAARPRKYRQIAHARTRAAVLMEDPLLPIAKPYLTQVLLVLLLRDRSLPQVDLQNLEPRLTQTRRRGRRRGRPRRRLPEKLRWRRPAPVLRWPRQVEDPRRVVTVAAGIRPDDEHVLPGLQLHPPRHRDRHRLHVGRRPPVVDLHVHADHPEHPAPHPHHPSPLRHCLHRVLLVFPHKRSPGPQVLPDAQAAFSVRSRAGRKSLLWGLSNIPGCTRIVQLSLGS